MHPSPSITPTPTPAVGHATTVQWGDVATWVGSLSQLGALIAATIAAVVAFKLFKNELKRDESAAEDRRQAAEDRRIAAEDRARAEQDRLSRIEEAHRAQAMKVAAWYGSRPVMMGPHERRQSGAWIRNASDLPIHAARVQFHLVDPNPGDGESITEHDVVDGIRLIPPNDDWFVQLRGASPNETAASEYIVDIAFTDAAGTRWRRDLNGRLCEVA